MSDGDVTLTQLLPSTSGAGAQHALGVRPGNSGQVDIQTYGDFRCHVFWLWEETETPVGNAQIRG